MARGTEISATVPPIEQLRRELQVRYDRRAPGFDDRYLRLGRNDGPATNHLGHAEAAELTRLARRFGHGRRLEVACGSGFRTRHRVLKVFSTPESLAALLRDGSEDVATWTTGRFFVVGRYRTARN